MANSSMLNRKFNCILKYDSCTLNRKINMTNPYWIGREAATHCHTQQHTATHCNTLQHTATHWSRKINLTHPCWVEKSNDIQSKSQLSMTDSTENTTSPKSTQIRNSNVSVQIQIKPKCPSEFVPRDTEESESLDLVDFGDVAFSVKVSYPIMTPY